MNYIKTRLSPKHKYIDFGREKCDLFKSWEKSKQYLQYFAAWGYL